MPRNPDIEEVWVIARKTSEGVDPTGVVRGTRENAESAAGQQPSTFVLGKCSLFDWRDDRFED